MRNVTNNNAQNVLALFATIRGKERSCDRCGQVHLTLPKGRANFCLECTRLIEEARKLALEGH